MSNIDKAYKKAMEKAFDLLETNVDVYIRTARSTDQWDPVYNEPIDPNIEPYVTTRIRVKGIFTWFKASLLERLAPGTNKVEQGHLHVRLADILKNKADPSQGSIFDDAEKIIVNGLECKVVSAPRQLGISTPYNVIVTLERST